MHSFHYSQKDSLPLFNRNSCTAGQKKGSEADLAALGRVAEFVSLSSETNADCRKGAIEAKRLGLPRVYPPHPLLPRKNLRGSQNEAWHLNSQMRVLRMLQC